MAKQENYFWENNYIAAILETDETRLRERIQAVKEMIAVRMNELGADGMPEREALSKALAGLSQLERERLHGNSGGRL
jgi:hypothetical protein